MAVKTTTRKTVRAVLAAGLIIGSTGAVLARGGGGGGGSDSGSGLSPYAALNGNDRSAGVNNGNYRDPRLDPYLGAYGDGYGRPVQDRYRPVRRPYYGTPY
ncbi:hypothetical protein FV232_05875 [Methylobacterium sp. WL30]|uniref:hypothetical protein n=1 Tax=unclassified Methylobacterium TaxID=2615210 RepID=UPI0011C77859|nr:MULTISPECIES: hypothetical protein [unclassified Methylobacterium]MCJ2042740.1 hypothetical protein [Methylobacterium sp. J-059]TXM88833.1 hypothetical protein FV223_23400 [Methylobacterium sp. WL116]TXN21418.1 hypothetical protein FV225_26880 [Methylobacterium sp. WL93]TXN48125.1 hypothetical protein FV227_20510 [Methylobacterium sp. WL119]TXN64210.1 hypothetical protein FV230_18895 [Methylobacterium sp. WL6]